MRIAVMAAGAVGGYFGARLAAAGHDVTFFARGAHRDAIRSEGLRIESVRGDLHLKDARVTGTADGVGAVDVVLFAVKLWDTETAARLARPLVGRNTRVITAQNGIDSIPAIAPILGREHAVPGLAQIAAVIARPGVIAHTSPFHLLAFGHPDRRSDPVLEEFVAAGKAADVDFRLSDHIERELWMKFVILVALSSVTAAARLPLGALRDDADGKELLRSIMREAVAVGRARGAPCDDALAEEAFAFVDRLPEDMKASMAHDIERGNRLELDWLAGRVLSLGRKLGVATPSCAAIYALLKPYRMGAR